MSKKPTKLDPKAVKEKDARQTAMMERRIGASLNSIALAFAASRSKKNAGNK
ncbi:hypothetical protein [Rhizobium leguminosarum]|uniref:hypothetical protein n=1 Tax=Rhizobium leguminosarum TaxID=384 RepID=UPI0013EE8C8D|nr:hypothetical protein [Rhizobium leguminosarum]